MAELIFFQDAEDLVRKYLRTALAAQVGFEDAEVYASRGPAEFPDLSVLVRRTGGPSRDLVTDLAQLTLECRALNDADAISLAGMCRALMQVAERLGEMLGVPVYEVQDFSGLYEDPDPDNPAFSRYSGTYQVAVRGFTAA